MTKSEYMDYLNTIPDAEVYQPFRDSENTFAARHKMGKWFALIIPIGEIQAVNLKCDPLESEFLQSVFQGIKPGYHMNKRHWITVNLDSDVPTDEIQRMTLNSHTLTQKKIKKKQQPQ